MDEFSGRADVDSDESLILLARAGDRGAFAKLWQRHSRSGALVARQFSSSIDPEDLVAEAFASIYQRVLAGGGPDGAFRPYLYTTIRNLASRWGRERRDVNVEDIGDWVDPAAESDPAAVALDRTLTVRAFRALPERWQTVLWYTEVEGLDPHEVAPILGISANSVAALSYRAREGLRKAWLQAHVSDATASGACQWSIARLGDYARNGLTARERTRVTDHLATCARCSIISEEVDEVGSRLALVMLPLLLGGVAGGAFLSALSTPASALAASAAPALPSAFASLTGVATPPIALGLAAPAISAPLSATLAIALVFCGGVAANQTAIAHSPLSSSAHARQVGAQFADAPPGDTQTGGSVYRNAPRVSVATATVTRFAHVIDPLIGLVTVTDIPTLVSVAADVPGVVGGAGATAAGLATGVTNQVGAVLSSPDSGATAISSAAAVLDVAGTGVPGATVTLHSAGIVYATTTVGALGQWAIHCPVPALPTAGLTLQQTVAGLLGTGLDAPLVVLSNSLGVPLVMVNG